MFYDGNRSLASSSFNHDSGEVKASTYHALLTTADSSFTSFVKRKQTDVHNVGVGKTSTTISSTALNQSSSLINKVSAPLVTSKEKSENSKKSVEAETSSTFSRVRRRARQGTTKSTLPQRRIVRAI
ncbi:hypothetical protein EWB00_010575 [Schistosoma japonicum]|uniref:Uncharacterized protein n=1 Tax=Schistosoma japonicum TaxID=6182 RepID=A0A4Z2DPR5_SCHJA|nr:hypothetical protein EWB00_010575 [Schistosoma japonicum]